MHFCHKYNLVPPSPRRPGYIFFRFLMARPLPRGCRLRRHTDGFAPLDKLPPAGPGAKGPEVHTHYSQTAEFFRVGEGGLLRVGEGGPPRVGEGGLPRGISGFGPIDPTKIFRAQKKSGFGSMDPTKILRGTPLPTRGDHTTMAQTARICSTLGNFFV